METLIPEAKPMEKAKNLIGTLARWSQDDFKKVNTPTMHQRLQFCASCPYWNKDAFMGLGKCGICGCSVAKLYIPAVNCPHPQPRWLATTEY